MSLVLETAVERWPIAGEFRIARGAKTEAEVVVANLRRGGRVGRGECVPYPRYGQSSANVVRQLEAAAAELEHGASVSQVLQLGRPFVLPSAVLGRLSSRGVRGGFATRAHPAEPTPEERRELLSRRTPTFGLDSAATSALTSAWLDLEAKETGVPVWTRYGLPAPTPTPIAWTLSIDTPDAMAARAADAAVACLKVKLAGDGLDLARLAAIHAARPDVRLWVDANEGLDPSELERVLPQLAALGVVLVEQPLPAQRDDALEHIARPVPVCADESLSPALGPGAIARSRYDAVNIKLDKAAGLLGAKRQIDEARRLGFQVALGCMVSTSLSIAPALLLAPLCDWVDLDGAALLARDRDGAPSLERGVLVPNELCGWGR